MSACGPFEGQPHIALGVSGGPDSIALMLLLKDWVASRGGRLTALTVDHLLRPDSTLEAAQVATWAAEAGIPHHILSWTGSKPQAGIQAAARRARYELLTSWCRDNDVLHLATAHQRDDQAETVAMRRARNPDEHHGLAGMSQIAARNGVRLIRPLLSIPAGTLQAYLAARGHGWIDDPSNRQTRFERIRWRQGLEGPLPSAADIRAWGERRVTDEASVADLLMRSSHIHDAGYVLIDLDPWRNAVPAIRVQALGQLVAMVAGLDYLPAKPALKRALDGLLEAGPVQSLGGALLGNWRGQGLICREAADLPEEIVTLCPARFTWDRRMAVATTAGAEGLRIGGLGEGGIAEIGQSGLFRMKDKDIPPLARASLPALRDATGRLIAVPHLGFDPYGRGQCTYFRFLPYYSVTSSGFTVAYGWPHTI